MLFATTIVLLVHVSTVLCGVATAWENFWSSTCEFSTIVSRSRRSVHEPDIRNPEQLFEYLYPLADVKVEDLISNSGRSSQVHPHSLSNWLDDIVDLWQSECHDRHKRSLNKRQADSGSSSGWNMFRRNTTHSENGYEEEKYGDEEESKYESEADSGDANEKEGEDAEAAPAPVSATPEVKDDDTFFAAYGGDIEYFFPLISFGIPFDGEISLLGFHGFKGLFPYR